jgi:WD40 repeat protein
LRLTLFVVSPGLRASVAAFPPAASARNPCRLAGPGSGTLAWSADGSYLATVNDNMPHAVWVWDLRVAELAAVLCHISAVKTLAWSPAPGGALAAASGGGRLYLWSPRGASVVHVPLPGFSAAGVLWSADGGALALHGKDAFCCGYVSVA